MTLAALHPEHIRTLVLDSLYPPDPIPPRSVLAKSALEAFFATCAQDQACSTSFPDLAATYRETVDRLQHTTLTVAFPPGTLGADRPAQLTPSSFEALVYSLLYYPPNYPGMPRLITAVHDGQTQGLGSVIASIIKEIRQRDLALSVAVECRDRPQLRALPPSDANVYDRRELNSICNAWSALGPAPLIPTATQVPTLVLGGQFDPVAGPSLSRRIVDQLGDKARLVEFPLIGHNVRAFSVCGAKVASDFIDRPGETPDTSCVDRPPAIKFLH
jgi:pimeloyl-ACP methyl ester carboxylesterase